MCVEPDSADVFLQKNGLNEPPRKTWRGVGRDSREVRTKTAVNRKILDIGGVERSSTNVEVK